MAAASRSFLGIHHIKIPSSDLEKTKQFYTQHLPLVHQTQLDHVEGSTGKLYAIILTHAPSATTLEIRLAPDHAARQTRWNPITWSVGGLTDLEAWERHFADAGIKHSRVLKGVLGWVLCVEDPDGRHVRLYTVEEHEWTTDVDRDEYWLES